MDRLAAEWRAATEDLATQRKLAAAWEAQVRSDDCLVLCFTLPRRNYLFLARTTQAQDALTQIDRLRGILEESAEWEAQQQQQQQRQRHSSSDSTIAAAHLPQHANGVIAAPQRLGQPPASPAEAAAAMVRGLQAALMDERARSADLELGMRALAAGETVRLLNTSVRGSRDVLMLLSCP